MSRATLSSTDPIGGGRHGRCHHWWVCWPKHASGDDGVDGIALSSPLPPCLGQPSAVAAETRFHCPVATAATAARAAPASPPAAAAASPAPAAAAASLPAAAAAPPAPAAAAAFPAPAA